MFHGSYAPDDATFLLKPVDLPDTPIEEKERWIQSGRRHYSEMITREKLPSPRYLEVFHRGMVRNAPRLARDVLHLARILAERRPGPITLVSLARAGTPIGVLLVRVLGRYFQREAVHYSISIIRDRGIDGAALRFILSKHPPESLAFVDGWTGKGVIAAELARSLSAFHASTGVRLDPGLFAVADLSGSAGASATSDDYLIPCCVLGATVSGLISRSILNDAVVGPEDFHGCLYYHDFEPHDLSRWFVDEILRHIDADHLFATEESEDQEVRRHRAQAAARKLQERFRVANPHFLKPGIGEATRVLLRRMPERLILREPTDPETEHLRVLAEEKRVPVSVEPTIPYRAVALVRELET